MKNIVKYLQEYVENHIENLISQDSSQTIRKIFCGLPYGLSEELLQALNTHESDISEKLGIPVVLYDPKVKSSDIPNFPAGGVADEDYILRLRNTASISRFIVILPLIHSLNKSIATSFSNFGFNPEIGRNSNRFTEDLLVIELIESGFERLSFDNNLKDELKGLFIESLSLLDDSNNSDDENLHQWQLLSNLWAIKDNDSEKLLKIIALAGVYPPENDKSINNKSYKKLLLKIGNQIEKNGISKFFNDLIDREDIEPIIKKCLQELNDHIHLYTSAGAEFNSCPTFYYSPYIDEDSDVNSSLVNWWKVLSYEVWDMLLGDEEEEKGILNVVVSNALRNTSRVCVPFTKDKIQFDIKGTNLNSDESIEISFKRQSYDKIGETCLINKMVCWEFNDIPIHKGQLNFKFTPISSLTTSVIRVYSLSTFKPGIAFFTSQAEKISMLSERTKKRKGSTSTKQLWQSDIKLANGGFHELEIFIDEKRIKLSDSATLTHVNTDELKQEPLISKFRKDRIEVGKYYLSIEVSEDSTLNFQYIDSNSDVKADVEVNFTVNENEAKGVSSIIHKLILQNCSQQGAHEKIDIIPVWDHLHQLQHWMVENELSYIPIVLGTDYSLFFNPPNWESQRETILSGKVFNTDFRGYIENYLPPKELIDSRNKIRNILSGSQTETDDNKSPLMEYFDINNSIYKEDLEKITREYLEYYINWYNESPEKAAWFDTVSIVDINGGFLCSEPLCVLLSPLHPIRIGWNVIAQKILAESLNLGRPCPAAGTIDSSSVVDIMAMPCSQPGGSEFVWKPFVSINNDSYTWSILWHGEKLDKLKDEEILSLFTDEMGLKVEGIVSGLTLSQVEHSIDDISKIKCAKSKIKVLVTSDSGESSYLNDGIFSWVKNRLGPKEETQEDILKDIWFEAGPTSLEIYDTRNEDYYPEPEKLADASQVSHGSLKWFNTSNDFKDSVDLGVIGHLGSMEPKVEDSKTLSNNYYGCIRKNRIRHILYQDESIYFSESRISELKSNIDSSDISDILSKTSALIEGQASNCRFGNFRSIPKISMIHDCLSKADYCVVSSATIDPSAFFDPSNKSYIWDYDLPKYATQSSANTGFYLLARNSTSVRNSVINGLKQITQLKKEQKESVTSDVLLEISTRGIPTLKRLASGGNSASGEVGLVVALRMLQKSILDKSIESNEIIPFKTESGIYNLIIPVDPFQNQLEKLMKGLDVGKNRPDLLIMSFCEVNSVFSIKFTPIEVKFRDNIGHNLIKDALDQNIAMIDFLRKLGVYANESKLWSVAKNHFYSNIIDFAFRTYGRSIKDVQESIDWSKMQYRLIQHIFDNKQITIDDVGRVIVFANNANESNDIIDEDSDDFNETIIINKLTAIDLLNKKTNEVVEKFSLLKGWGTYTDMPILTIKEEDYKVQSENDQIKSELDKLVESSIPKPDNPKVKVEDSANGIYFKVGHYESLLKNKDYFFNPSNTNLNQLNVGIVGDLGTGKTQLIKALIYQISNQPEQNRGVAPKFLILDTKRDYDGSGEKETDRLFVDKINAKVVKPVNLKINLFDIRSSKDVNDPAFEKARFFIDLLRKVYDGIGSPQESNIRNAVINAYKEKGYLPDQEDYSNFIAPTINDVFLKYSEIVKEKKDTPYSIMEDLVMSRVFNGDANSTVDFRTFFNQSTVVSLGSIASMKQPLKLVLIIFLNLYREYMLSIKKEEYIKVGDFQLRKIDSFLLIDEANLIMEYNLPVLEDILLKGREFGVGVILASQYLSHFKQKSDVNYTQPLLSWFIHKVPNITINEISSLGIVTVDTSFVKKIQTLKPHHCLFKSLNVDGEFIEAVPFYELIKL